jgi:hypothetical protein
MTNVPSEPKRENKVVDVVGKAKYKGTYYLVDTNDCVDLLKQFGHSEDDMFEPVQTSGDLSLYFTGVAITKDKRTMEVVVEIIPELKDYVGTMGSLADDLFDFDEEE